MSNNPFDVVAELVYDAETGELVTVAGIPVATHPDVPEGHIYLTAGTSTPSTAAGSSPFADWAAEHGDPGTLDPEYEDAPANEPGPFDV